ncbi:tetratricopeptide repeat protein [Acuticoccus sp. MNP-M23]|uniref:tetratricopeptide repeat protein n=1 Tax=Acuticoccus sp. MNP-M23 TaxID=3072793 RepID=UPI002814E245|nr:tetratricopeptide repeat protein [Acuticoccus sp. MNP-M23]WMS41259.1 tetratricopeptide repeat protein [Acuticoccus sp. MNP-M23]
MSDIFKEVEDDLRRERLKTLWDRYGIFVLGAALLIVIITAGWRGYEAWETNRDRTAGDTYLTVLNEVEGVSTAGSADTLLAFAADAPGGYGILAEFRAATILADAGESVRAADLLNTIADDGEAPAVYRDLARIRQGQVLLDAGDAQAAVDVVSGLAEDAGNPFYASAQELMGLAAYAADDLSGARRWFTAVTEEVGTPPGVRARARFMLALITQTAPEADAAGTTAEEAN